MFDIFMIIELTGSSSRLPHSSVSQPSVPFLSLVPGSGLLGSDNVYGGLAGVYEMKNMTQLNLMRKLCKLSIHEIYKIPIKII